MAAVTSSSATAEKQRVSCLSRLAHWSCTSLNTVSAVHRRYIRVVYNSLAKVVSTLAAKKPSDIRGRWSFQALYTFKVSVFVSLDKKAVLSQRWPRDAPCIWKPWKISGILATPTATYPEIVNGFLLWSIVWKCLQNLKFVVLPVPKIIGGT